MHTSKKSTSTSAAATAAVTTTNAKESSKGKGGRSSTFEMLDGINGEEQELLTKKLRLTTNRKC